MRIKTAAPFLSLLLLAIIALFIPTLPNFDDGKYNLADIAWMIVATALVFLMTPALAFFYGGMVHRKNVISTMIKSMIAAGVVSVLWVVVGYSLCFGQSFHGVIGNPLTHFFFKGVNSGAAWVACAQHSEVFICTLPTHVRHHHARTGGWSGSRAYAIFILCSFRSII